MAEPSREAFKSEGEASSALVASPVSLGVVDSERGASLSKE